jgi:hypothetical protein
LEDEEENGGQLAAGELKQTRVTSHVLLLIPALVTRSDRHKLKHVAAPEWL